MTKFMIKDETSIKMKKGGHKTKNQLTGTSKFKLFSP